MRFGGEYCRIHLPSRRERVPARPKATPAGAFRPVPADLRLEHAVEVADQVLGIFQAYGQAENAVAGECAITLELPPRSLKEDSIRSCVAIQKQSDRWWPSETA